MSQNNSGLSKILMNHLRTAMGIELTTIPTYLYAYWSIIPVGNGGSSAGAEAASTIMSVVMEEMLHMGLVSNVLNALGGSPKLTSKPYVPEYPAWLFRHKTIGNCGFKIKLQRLSKPAIKTFLRIELPAEDVPKKCKGISSIGQFYDMVEHELGLLPDEAFSHGGQFPQQDNPGAGTMIQVDNTNTALEALSLIVEQGEGLEQGSDPGQHDDGQHELAHFWKFMAVKNAVKNDFLDLDKDVYPVINNPKVKIYSKNQRKANQQFNSTYSRLLDALQETMSGGSPEVFFKSTGLMEALGHQAAVLRNTGCVKGTNYLPGPTFDYLKKSDRS